MKPSSNKHAWWCLPEFSSIFPTPRSHMMVANPFPRCIWIIRGHLRASGDCTGATLKCRPYASVVARSSACGLLIPDAPLVLEALPGRHLAQLVGLTCRPRCLGSFQALVMSRGSQSHRRDLNIWPMLGVIVSAGSGTCMLPTQCVRV